VADRSTRTQRQAAAAMASMTMRAGSKRVRYRAAPVMWECLPRPDRHRPRKRTIQYSAADASCVLDCPLARAMTISRTSDRAVMAAAGPTDSPLANDLGELQVRL